MNYFPHPTEVPQPVEAVGKILSLRTVKVKEDQEAVEE